MLTPLGSFEVAENLGATLRLRGSDGTVHRDIPVEACVFVAAAPSAPARRAILLDSDDDVAAPVIVAVAPTPTFIAVPHAIPPAEKLARNGRPCSCPNRDLTRSGRHRDDCTSRPPKDPRHAHLPQPIMQYRGDIAAQYEGHNVVDRARPPPSGRSLYRPVHWCCRSERP